MENLVGKKVKSTLVGLDGNAFVLLGRFQNTARKQGWTGAEIKAVADEAMCLTKNFTDNGFLIANIPEERILLGKRNIRGKIFIHILSIR